MYMRICILYRMDLCNKEELLDIGSSTGGPSSPATKPPSGTACFSSGATAASTIAECCSGGSEGAAFVNAEAPRTYRRSLHHVDPCGEGGVNPGEFSIGSLRI